MKGNNVISTLDNVLHLIWSMIVKALYNIKRYYSPTEIRNVAESDIWFSSKCIQSSHCSIKHFLGVLSILEEQIMINICKLQVNRFI